MGTHPIFESDFDCLTDMLARQIISKSVSRSVKYTTRPSKTLATWRSWTDSWTLEVPLLWGNPTEKGSLFKTEHSNVVFGKEPGNPLTHGARLNTGEIDVTFIG